MAQLEIPNRYLALSPVIVTSPVARCGTTLVQRLLTQSSNGFCYGEGVGKQVKVLTTWFVEQMQAVDRMGATYDQEFAEALAGTHAEWRPNMMPPGQVMLKAWTETYYQLPMTLSQHALAVGRPVWGWKYPGYSRDMLKALLMLMPRAKVIYVFRNLYDALKSAKARKFVTTPEEIAAYCAEWAQNLAETSAISADERVLFLRYENLVEDREQHVKLLEIATGAEGLDAAVFDTRVNTFKGGEENGFSDSQYIQPAPLTDADRAAVAQHAGEVMAQLYPDTRDAA